MKSLILRLSHIAAILILTVTLSWSQCPDLLKISTAGSIESFLQDYPNCTELPGDLQIGYSQLQLTSIVGLEQITKVNGDVVISAPALETLSGLEGLTEIEGDLNIFVWGGNETGNYALKNLDGLSNLVSVGGDIEIQGMKNLESMRGLSSLITVGGEFDYTANAGQPTSTILFPENVQSIGGILDIFPYLETAKRIRGFENLSEVGGITVWPTPNPLSYYAFDNLVTSNGNLRLVGDTVFLSRLERVNGNLEISNTTHLAGCENLVAVEGNLSINNGHFQSFPQFISLEEVGRELGFYNNDFSQHPDVLAFVNLGVIGARFQLNDNPGLRSLSGFNALGEVGVLEENEVYRGFFIHNNEDLEGVLGFDNLLKVLGPFQIRNNSHLVVCDAFCNFLEVGEMDHSASIYGNDDGCNSRTQVIESCDRPNFMLIEANIDFLPDPWLGEAEKVEDVPAIDLLSDGVFRNAIAADGITKVVLAVEFPEPGLFDYEINGMPLTKQWGSQTIEYDGKHYGLAILTAPDEFPGDINSDQNQYQLAESKWQVSALLAGDPIQEFEINIPVVRPPVVLMHGTFSNPGVWSEKLNDEGTSMADALIENGFSIHPVDYENTNGKNGAEMSSFQDNARVLYDNPNGIKDALDHYRFLDIAVTQVDVVGHSMGGVLPRVYASDNYNDDYYRANNFNQGDINRLITFGSTHFGSHVAEFQMFIGQIPITSGVYNAAIGRLITHVASWISGTAQSEAVIDQLPGSDALRNIGHTDIPSHAITCRVEYGNIASAIDPDNYKTAMGASSWGIYAFGPWYPFVEYKLDRYRDSELQADESASGAKWTDVVKGVPGLTANDPMDAFEQAMQMMDIGIIRAASIMGLFEGDSIDFDIPIQNPADLPKDVEIFDPVMSDLQMSRPGEDDWWENFKANSSPETIQSLYRDLETIKDKKYLESSEAAYYQFIDLFRYLVFDNDHNDGTVRVESQAAGLPEEYVTHLYNVWHGPAPKYPEVQQAVVDLLASEMDKFSTEGIPAYPQANTNGTYLQKMYFPPDIYRPRRELRSRSEAICHSGMVPSHAEAFARIADSANAIVITRPVNYDGTPLIEKGAATKEMDVKPKSSNWGPQKGYLPFKQRYSKIWTVFPAEKRKDKINTYDAKARSNLEGVNPIATTRQLKVNLCQEEYFVYINEAIAPTTDEQMGDGDAFQDIVLVPVMNPELVCTWTADESYDVVVTKPCKSIQEYPQLAEFLIMAAPKQLDEEGNPRFLTADYDLLMFGFNRGADNPYNPPTDIPFQDNIGQMTTEQSVLAQRLNAAVRNAGYQAGNVTHHGPENQFSLSPYVDYPLTAFAPDDIAGESRGRIVSIPMGPKGYRDVYLKQFVNDMRRKGFDLYDNRQAPGWKWTWNEDKQQFDLADSPDIGDYVAELVPNGCEKFGSISDDDDLCKNSDEKGAVLTPETNDANNSSLSIFPNPNYGSEFTVTITSPHETIEWTITDIYGRPHDSGIVNNTGAPHTISTRLSPGMYYFNTADGVERFVVR